MEGWRIGVTVVEKTGVMCLYRSVAAFDCTESTLVYWGLMYDAFLARAFFKLTITPCFQSYVHWT